MIREYIRERQSWIYLFFILQALLLFVAYLDASINFQSILYVVFLSVIIFTLFMIIRYQKESAYYRTLKSWYPSDDLGYLKEADKPFEKISERTIRGQAEYYKKELNDNIRQVEQEKDDLLSWIHEVKTPLTAMQLMIERLENDQLKSQLQYEWLRIHLLLDQQLHQRRMPSMENDLYIERVAIKPLVYREIKDLRTWCMQKGIGFDVNLEITDVLTDVKWFSFIIRQLLTNAVKYSENSDIVISSVDNDGEIQLIIQDAGRGIPKKDLPRIFDKGFTSTKNHEDYKATGMGLYLTKKAADTLKIKMDVQSKVGKGTVFTLTFAKKNTFLGIEESINFLLLHKCN
ncbi:HAMP domain-containing sensor histidine kinase [Oceanobacillus sp. Castelsardo]|uniref:sensor histidine kinase n=1 Tax=Oceanobacillus sp. Castelsardo TaxID=1851204 RepID=UPI0008383572|nr:sensor histidine kinase [Oceanobacillus sp. Castelsardo]